MVGMYPNVGYVASLYILLCQNLVM